MDSIRSMEIIHEANDKTINNTKIATKKKTKQKEDIFMKVKVRKKKGEIL